MGGLDGHHRNEDGRIERKRGDTKVENLKGQYPELERFPDEATLGNSVTGITLTVSTRCFGSCGIPEQSAIELNGSCCSTAANQS
jgi:hypothetical protein